MFTVPSIDNIIRLRDNFEIDIIKNIYKIYINKFDPNRKLILDLNIAPPEKLINSIRKKGFKTITFVIETYRSLYNDEYKNYIRLLFSKLLYKNLNMSPGIIAGNVNDSCMISGNGNNLIFN